MSDRNDRLRPVILKADRSTAHLQELRRTLARLERSDSMTLARLLAESESQISNETTMIVILQQASAETISALIGYAQRGKSVAAIINTHTIDDYSMVAGPLIAVNIATFHLSDEESIRDICRQVNLRAV